MPGARGIGAHFGIAIVAVAGVVAALSPVAHAGDPTTVSLTFDETVGSQYQARSMLASRGMQATFYVNSGRVGQDGYLTRSQLLDLEGDGNEIAGHTVNRSDLTEVDSVEQSRQICNDRATLLNWGFEVRSFAYPFGKESPGIAQVAQDCGYNSARDTGGIAEDAPAEAIPPLDAFAIRSARGDSASLSELQSAVTRAEQGGGGWVVFYFHGVCDGCGTNAISPTTLDAFMDWLAPRSSEGTTVETVGEVIGGEVKPGSPGPPPPSIRSGNVLLNPSLETDATANGVPDCWQRDAVGANSSTWTRTTDAHSGGYAERVNVTSYSSGAVHLLSQQDLGYCAPTAFPGHTYTLSAWYKGALRPRLVAFHRTGVGAWRVFGQSSRFNRSTRWKRATWTPPPLPPGATGIGIGVAVDKAGSLTIDDLAVSDTAPPDTTAPNTSITAGPGEGSSTGSSSASFAFGGSDNVGVAGYECQLDGSAWSRCSSPRAYRGLSVDSHTFSVRARDTSGNVDPSPATRTWTVTPPGDVYTVPSSVPSGCSTDARSQILSWIASVPDDSTLQFEANACYRVEGTVEFRDRRLTIDGNGATFQSLDPPTSQGAMWRAWDSTVTFRNMTITGSYANGGVLTNELQWAHGIDLRGTQGVVENVSMSDLAGDCVYFGLGADRSSGAVRDSSCQRIGRNGVSVTAGNDILVERVTTDRIGYIAFDVEPNTGTGNWGSARVTFDSNTIGSYFLKAYTVLGNAPVSDQEFTNNRVVGQSLEIGVEDRGYRPQNLKIAGNSSDTAASPPAMNLDDIDGLTVSGNTVPLAGGTMAQVDNSCNVDVFGNSYPGGSQEASITNSKC
jgi:peptidoglycan/xylan/chitin deacetylase (PgdA/CDA1 family)